MHFIAPKLSYTDALSTWAQVIDLFVKVNASLVNIVCNFTVQVIDSFKLTNANWGNSISMKINLEINILLRTKLTSNSISLFFLNYNKWNVIYKLN